MGVKSLDPQLLEEGIDFGRLVEAFIKIDLLLLFQGFCVSCSRRSLGSRQETFRLLREVQGAVP